MIKKCIPCFIILALCCGGASSDETTKKEKIAKLIEAIGLRENFHDIVDNQKKVGKEIIQQPIKDAMAGISLTTAEQANLDKITDNYLDKTASPFTLEQYTDCFTNTYNSYFSEAEIDDLLRFYTSDLGRKSLKMSREAYAYLTSMKTEPLARYKKAFSEFDTELVGLLAGLKQSRGIDTGAKVK